MHTAVPGCLHVHHCATLSFPADLLARYSLPSDRLPGAMSRQRQRRHVEFRNRHDANGHLSRSLRERGHERRAHLSTPMCL